jgi:hypothetical protein
MIKDSESHEMIQIEQAAAGCVSGTLAEWPHLKSALRRRGIKLSDSTTADKVREVCKQYLTEQKQNK